MRIDALREFQDCTAVLHLVDGEILKAKIAFVDAEYDDIVVDVLETNQSEHYKGPANSCHTVRASDILSLEKI